MIYSSLLWSLMLAGVMCAAADNEAAARSSDSLPAIEMLFASSSGSPSSSSQPTSPFEPLRSHVMDKRAIFDLSCKGIYDREIFMRLDRVCEDCYNLYRKPYVALGCRKRCYRNLVFRQCLDDLQLRDNVESYAESVRMVGK